MVETSGLVQARLAGAWIHNVAAGIATVTILTVADERCQLVFAGGVVVAWTGGAVINILLAVIPWRNKGWFNIFNIFTSVQTIR